MYMYIHILYMHAMYMYIHILYMQCTCTYIHVQYMHVHVAMMCTDKCQMLHVAQAPEEWSVKQQFEHKRRGYLIGEVGHAHVKEWEIHF